jgi:uncharacterized protein (DUF952 family)
MLDKILHICTQSEWQTAQTTSEYRAESLATAGFIHCSRPEQILKVANQYYPGVSNLVLLWINIDKLNADLRWEESDGDVFPHLYGPLNLDAVIVVLPFPPDKAGVFQTFPELE